MEEGLHRFGFLLAAVAATAAAGPARAADLAPSPPELMLAFDSYTRHIGLDPTACSFGVWNRDIVSLSPKEAMDNAFARCTPPAGYKACTRIAGELPDQAQVKDGCIAGFDRLSFLAWPRFRPRADSSSSFTTPRTGPFAFPSSSLWVSARSVISAS